MELAVASAMSTVWIATAAEGTLRHLPVMVTAFVQAMSAIGHRGMVWAGKFRPVAGETRAPSAHTGLCVCGRMAPAVNALAA